MEGRPPMVATAKTTARQLHLVRAAQSAGEAFACPLTDDDAPRRWLSARVGAAPFVWLAAGICAAAGLALVF
jgi:hypothetical protein